MREDLGGEDRDVVTGVRLAGNVESLLGVFWELLEEQSHKGVDILSSRNSVADLATRVRVADVDGLIQEDHRGIGVPGEGVEVKAYLLVDE